MQVTGQPERVERVSGSHLVELSCVVPMGSEDPALVAKTAAAFAHHLAPFPTPTLHPSSPHCRALQDCQPHQAARRCPAAFLIACSFRLTQGRVCHRPVYL